LLGTIETATLLQRRYAAEGSWSSPVAVISLKD